MKRLTGHVILSPHPSEGGRVDNAGRQLKLHHRETKAKGVGRIDDTNQRTRRGLCKRVRARP